MDRRTTNRSRWYLRSIVITMTLTTFGLLSSLPDSVPVMTSPTPYPTDYPPEKQTPEVAERQTQEAALLTPSPPLGSFFMSSSPTLEPEQIEEPQGTPAGDGVILSMVGPPPVSGQAFTPWNAWYKSIEDGYILVYAGEDGFDPSQGVVIFVRVDPSGPRWYSFDTPAKAGGVEVVDAVGERLILRSSNGETFYFDVPGQQFASSPTEIIPTVTPESTLTPAPTRTPPYFDDAPNEPGYVYDNSPTNADLRYFINPSGDEDWFRFRTEIASTLRISLTNLPADYDLFVFSVSNISLERSSTKVDRDDELVILVDAPPDDYYVRVVGKDGGWNQDRAYVLRFVVDATQGRDQLWLILILVLILIVLIVLGVLLPRKRPSA